MWIREGYCCRCGDCCKGEPFGDPPDPSGHSEMMQQPAAVAGYCPLFVWHLGDPNGDGFCKGHTGAVPAGTEDPYYLSGCNVWPTVPQHTADFPNCTYTWRWQDDPP